MDAGLRVLVAPVGHVLLDEVGVGHDDGHVVERVDGRAAGVDGPNGAEDACNLDEVPGLDGSYEQQDEPADEVARDVLKTEPRSRP